MSQRVLDHGRIVMRGVENIAINQGVERRLLPLTQRDQDQIDVLFFTLDGDPPHQRNVVGIDKHVTHRVVEYHADGVRFTGTQRARQLVRSLKAKLAGILQNSLAQLRR